MTSMRVPSTAMPSRTAAESSVRSMRRSTSAWSTNASITAPASAELTSRPTLPTVSFRRRTLPHGATPNHARHGPQASGEDESPPQSLIDADAVATSGDEA